MKNKKELNPLSNYILLSLGFICIVLATIVFYNYITINNRLINIDAIVESIINDDNERSITVQYEYNDMTYHSSLKYFDGNLDIGDNVKIYIDKANPDTIYSAPRGRKLLYSILYFLGITLLIYNMYLIICKKKEWMRINKLITMNNYTLLKIVSVEENEKMIKHGITPKMIFCEVNNGIVNKIINSKLIYLDADLSSLVGKEIKVYFEDETFDNYYIDYNY